MKDAIVNLIVDLIVIAMCGALGMVVYNAIAWEFNLPLTNFWFTCLVYITYKSWTHKDKKSNNEN